MLEESVESFILHYKPYAALVEILPYLEGSPLLECVVGNTVVQVLERTAPYLARPGKMRLIINPTAKVLEPAEEIRKSLVTVATSRIRATGPVLELGRQALIVDAGTPLVVSFFGSLPEGVAVGEWVQFESLAPLHGFVLPTEPRDGQARSREPEGDSL